MGNLKRLCVSISKQQLIRRIPCACVCAMNVCMLVVDVRNTPYVMHNVSVLQNSLFVAGSPTMMNFQAHEECFTRQQ